MEFVQSFEFVKKHKTQIFLPLICLMLFLACFFRIFWIFATVFGIALLLLSDFADTIYYLLFFQLFSCFGKFSVTCTFVGAVLICIKYIIGVIKKQDKFYPIPFVLTCVICFVCSIHFYKIDSKGIYQGFSLIAALFLIYLLFANREKFKLIKCADYLLYGIIVSIAFSLLLLIFKGEIITVFHPYNNDFSRLKLLTSNENSLAIYCSLSLSIYVSTILGTRKDLIKNILLGTTAICVGLFTLSKCFLIIATFIIFYLIFMLILKYKKQSLKIILPLLAVLAIASLIMFSRISTIFERFFISLDSKLDLSVITTGRSDLWTMYINEITSSIPKMLFGVGFFNERLIYYGPHNLLIHLLYRMGFVGLILLGVLTYYYYQSSHKSIKINLKNCLPIIVFFLISMVENFL